MRNNRYKKGSSQGTYFDIGPVFYEIKIQGQLDPQRSTWFEGMTLTFIENKEKGMSCTLITGPVIDQPALHGLLTKIRDLNLTLISIQRVVPGTNTLEEVPLRPEPPEDRDDLD